jgi:polyisoprenoid-binding protein YceI
MSAPAVSPVASTVRVVPAPAAAARYSIDAAHSHVGFAVRHLMISNVRGEFTALEGVVAYDAEHPEATSVEVKIDVASLNTREEKRDAHLRSADFFDAEHFPHILFSSNAAKVKGDGLELTGDLTIHGVTREVKLAVADITPESKDPFGNRKVGASAKTKIRRSDFGMQWNAALETGGVLVGDEITITLEVELTRL